jgi:hypothetical protein
MDAGECIVGPLCFLTACSFKHHRGLMEHLSSAHKACRVACAARFRSCVVCHLVFDRRVGAPVSGVWDESTRAHPHLVPGLVLPVPFSRPLSRPFNSSSNQVEAGMRNRSPSTENSMWSAPNATHSSTRYPQTLAPSFDELRCLRISDHAQGRPRHTAVHYCIANRVLRKEFRACPSSIVRILLGNAASQRSWRVAQSRVARSGHPWPRVSIRQAPPLAILNTTPLRSCNTTIHRHTSPFIATRNAAGFFPEKCFTHQPR